MKPCIIIPLMKTLFRLFVISLGILSLCFFACSNSTISEIIDGYWYDIDSGEVIYINGKEGIRAYYDSPSFEQSMYSTFKSLFKDIDKNDGTVQFFNITPKVLRDTKKPSDRISDSCWNLLKGPLGAGLESKKDQVYYIGCYGSSSGETQTVLLFNKNQSGGIFISLTAIRCDLLEGEFETLRLVKIDKNTTLDDWNRM